MTLPHVDVGDPPIAAEQNALIDRAIRNTTLDVTGLAWSSGALGQTIGPPPQVGQKGRHFELYDSLAPGGTPQAYPRPWDEDANDYATDTAADTFEVVDALKRFRGRARDEGASAEDDSGGTRGKHGSRGIAMMRHGRLEIEYLQPHATFLTCLVNEASDFTTSTEPVDVDNVQVVQPTDKALLMADVTSVVNIWDWAGLNNQRVKALWNDSAEQWEMDMKKCDPAGA
jgi:hypothetical protein